MLINELGKDPGLIKDGVEAHLQELLAAQIDLIGEGAQLIRREYMTPIGPVDILAKDATGQTVAIEIKRRGEIDGVEQLTRYLELLNRDAVHCSCSRYLRSAGDQASGCHLGQGPRYFLLDSGL